MADRRIIAYYMHETEQSAANSIVKTPILQQTESYLVCDADEQTIEELRKAGIMIGLMPEGDEEEAALDEIDEVAFGLPVPDTEPKPFIVRLEGTLSKEWRDELEAQGAEAQQSFAPNQFLVKLNPEQVTATRNLGFVKSVRSYGAQQTLIVRADAGLSGIGRGPQEAEESPVEELAFDVPATAGAEVREVLFDLILHAQDQKQPVLDWLLANNLTARGTGRWKVRVALAENAPELEQLRALPQIAQIEEVIEPTLFNDVVRERIGLDNAGAVQIPYTGAGQIVGVADTGLDETHPDFPAARVQVIARGRPGRADDPDGHGTHVAGTVLGGGVASGGTYRGVAPDASLFFQSLLDAEGRLGGLPIDLYDLFKEAYAAGVRIHNNSWGANSAAHYRLTSREVDDFVWEHPDMLLVFAAGNSGSWETPPAAGRVGPGFVDWLSVGSPATAKNALTVGASRSTRTAGGYAALTHRQQWRSKFPVPTIANENISGDPECLAGFSSRGPCLDNRIKPDLVAVGTDVVSTKSSLAPLRNFWGPVPGQPNYAYLGGTSMAAPVVAGAAALVREFYMSGALPGGPHTPSAALLKATLINGCRKLTGWDAIADHNTRPNYHQGFGALYLPATIPNPATPALKLLFWDPWQLPAKTFATNGKRVRFQFDVNAGTPLRICMAYTDLPGAGRQNHVTLFVERAHANPPEKWEGNSELPNNPLKVADPYNNVQAVHIEQPTSGKYTVMLAATNVLQALHAAFVVTGDLASPLTEI